MAGKGKPCGGSHIAANKECRVGISVQPGEGVQALKAKAREKGLGRGQLRKIAAAVREKHGLAQVGGEEGLKSFQRRVNELIEKGEPPKSAVKQAEKELTRRPQEQESWGTKDILAMWGGTRGKKAPSVPPDLKKEIEALGKPKSKPLSKPDELWGAWDDDALNKQLRFFKNKEAGPKRDEQIKRIEKELERRKGAPPEKEKGGTRPTFEKQMSDLSRLMRGEEPKYMDIVSAPGEAGAGARMKSKSEIAKLQSALSLGQQTRGMIGRDLEGLREEALAQQRQLVDEVKRLPAGPQQRRAVERLQRINDALEAKTAASAGTRYARESAREFDQKMATEKVRRDGDASFNRWDETTGKGAKKLGSGAFGTVVKDPDGTYAVKRGDMSDSEARLIKKLGDADLGPKLIAADVDGPGNTSNPGVDVRRGRMAMSIVPGKPIGYKEPDTKIGGVRVADAYWTARANLHRLGIAHNDMHIDNVLVDKKGKGRFVDMGLSQESPKAALAEALGAFDPPRGAAVTRNFDAAQPGDWQVKRWKGTGGEIMQDIARGRPGARDELLERAPLAARVWDNKNALQYQMKKDGYTLDEIGTLINHGIRSKPESYNKGVWARMSNEQAMNYINLLYDGV